MRSQIIEQLANMKGNMLSKFSMPPNRAPEPLNALFREMVEGGSR